jgi:hypothetical protein
VSLDRLPPASALVECSGTVHRLIWATGRLETPDHADPDAERTLTALGGAPCRCIELLDAWRAHADDPQVLVIGPRGPKITVVQAGGGQGGRSGMTWWSYGGSTPALPAVELEDLLMLRGGLPRRLVATTAAALITRTDEAAVSRRLHAALYGRLLVSLGRWLGELPELELEVLSPGTAPSLNIDGSLVRAAVAPDWLIDVWGAGLEIVADRFTLKAVWDVAGPGLSLRGVDQLMAPSTTVMVGVSDR